MHELSNSEINYISGGIDWKNVISFADPVFNFIGKSIEMDSTTLKIGFGIWAGLMLVEYVASYAVPFIYWPVTTAIAIGAALFVGHASKAIKQSKKK